MTAAIALHLGVAAAAFSLGFVLGFLVGRGSALPEAKAEDDEGAIGDFPLISGRDRHG